MNLKRHVRWGFALTTGVVLAAAGAAPALASSMAAPSQSPSPGAHAAYCQDFVTHLAQSLGVNQTRLQVALTRAASQTVDDAVARGDITSDQANTMKSRLTAGICGAHMGGFDIGGGAVSQNVVAAAATALGTTPEHVRSQLEQGKTISQIAPAGMTEQQFATKFESALKTQLDAKVKAGTMTESQENQVLQRAPALASHLWTHGGKMPSPGATAATSPAP